MIINNKFFDKTLKIHKQAIARMNTQKDLLDQDNLIAVIINTADALSLILADFKCQKCKTPIAIQFHHLITRYNRKFINDDIRYFCQRHYFANIIILCTKCHGEIHNFNNELNPTISLQKIEKIKKKLGENK